MNAPRYATSCVERFLDYVGYDTQSSETSDSYPSTPGQLDLLRRYQRQRKGENLLMMSAMDGFKRLFEQQSLPLRWLRNSGMRTVDRMLPLKQRLMRHAMGLG